MFTKSFPMKEPDVKCNIPTGVSDVLKSVVREERREGIIIVAINYLFRQTEISADGDQQSEKA